MSTKDWKTVRRWLAVHAEDCPAFQTKRVRCRCGKAPAMAAYRRLRAKARAAQKGATR